MYKFSIYTCLLLASTIPSFLFAQSYSAAESAEFDPTHHRWLVSNGNVIIDDGSGNLSVFGAGAATANYGLEIMDSTLFAVAGAAVIAYDLETEVEVGRVTISGAGFLNGLTNDGNGRLWVTDFSNNQIFEIDASDRTDPSANRVVNNTGVTPNGIVHDAVNNRLIFTEFGANGRLRTVDLSDYSVSTLVTTNVGTIDGIDDDGQGNYYISSWSPARISKYNSAFTNPPEIISTPFISNPADIGYSTVTDTLAIPIGNNVVFVGFAAPSSIDRLSAAAYGFKIYPNPVSDQSYLEFDLPRSTEVTIHIVDQSGKKVRTLMEGQQRVGNHKILLAGHALSAGVYYCHMSISAGQITERILIVK